MYYYGFALIVSMVGVAFLAAGTYFSSHDVFNAQSTKVFVRVVGNHENRTSDGVTYAPEFEVVSGPYQGRRWTGNHYSSPPVHEVGDETTGLFDPRSGQVVSDKSLLNDRLMNVMAISVGVGLLVSAGLFSFFGWPYRG